MRLMVPLSHPGYTSLSHPGIPPSHPGYTFLYTSLCTVLYASLCTVLGIPPCVPAWVHHPLYTLGIPP